MESREREERGTDENQERERESETERKRERERERKKKREEAEATETRQHDQKDTKLLLTCIVHQKDTSDETHRLQVSDFFIIEGVCLTDAEQTVLALNLELLFNVKQLFCFVILCELNVRRESTIDITVGGEKYESSSVRKGKGERGEEGK